MKKILFSIFLILAFSVSVWPQAAAAAVSSGSDGAKLAAAAKKTATKKAAKSLTAANLLGRLVLQKESDNKLWYIDPAAKKRYYLHTDDEVESLIAALGKKPTAKEFAKLAKNSKAKTPASLVKKYGGSIIISPAGDQAAYYMNPADGICYVINGYKDFYAVASVIGLSATDALLRQIAMNGTQETYDPAYYGTAYAKYDGTGYAEAAEGDRLLPLASLTKVMTALVFVETNPDWNKVVEITREEIDYPCTLQVCGSTSEVDLKAGDKLRVIDLWVSMLSASSNQSAVILADNSGLSREDFIKRMNQKAKDLGLIKTSFVEMSGLSADNVSTAKEYAKVAKAAFDNSWVAQATRSVDYVFTVEQSDGSPRDVRVANRNYSLLAMGPNASKTGYLVEAQRNAVVEKDGNIVIALHCYSLAQRNAIVQRLLTGSAIASSN